MEETALTDTGWTQTKREHIFCLLGSMLGMLTSQTELTASGNHIGSQVEEEERMAPAILRTRKTVKGRKKQWKGSLQDYGEK